ncbi:MAG TPA: AbrB/MazE/SpoVT family DNA-binding domain-containing protein [Xanthobacteraceae bacterium]
MRITSKGQVTIPAAIRERAGLLPHTEVDFEVDGRWCGLFAPMPAAGPVAVRASSCTCGVAATSP